MPVLIGAPIVAVLWLVLARANDRGQRWARAGAATGLMNEGLCPHRNSALVLYL